MTDAGVVFETEIVSTETLATCPNCQLLGIFGQDGSTWNFGMLWAYAIAAVFLGIELMERLDPTQSEADPVFDAMASLASLFEGVLGRT